MSESEKTGRLPAASSEGESRNSEPVWAREAGIFPGEE